MTTTRDDLTTATDLATLCHALNKHVEEARRLMRAGDESEAEIRLQEIERVLTNLPTFGGGEPREALNVWSWNATHELRQYLSGEGFHVVARADVATAARDANVAAKAAVDAARVAAEDAAEDAARVAVGDAAYDAAWGAARDAKAAYRAARAAYLAKTPATGAAPSKP